MTQSAYSWQMICRNVHGSVGARTKTVISLEPWALGCKHHVRIDGFRWDGKKPGPSAWEDACG